MSSEQLDPVSSARYFAGGGGGGTNEYPGCNPNQGTGGAGGPGGNAGNPISPERNAVVNTGGGGAGSPGRKYRRLWYSNNKVQISIGKNYE